MDQRAPYRCQQHNQLNGLGPQCYSKCRHGAEPSPVKAVAIVEAPKVKLAAKMECPAVKARKATDVSNTKPDVKPVSNGAARIARWRSKQDREVRKQQNREAVQRSRAKKKAGAR